MNDTQWLFELESLNYGEEKRYDELNIMAKMIREAAVSILGLNLMPIEEELPVELGGGLDETGKPIMRLRSPNENEIIPLAIMTGREEILSEILKRSKEMGMQDEATKYDDVPSIDAVEEFMMAPNTDMDFVDDEAMGKHFGWNVPGCENLIKPVSEGSKDFDEIELCKSVRRRPKLTIK
jgi:hypothetical protein